MKLKRLPLLVVSALLAVTANAQSVLKDIVLVNGGQFGNNSQNVEIQLLDRIDFQAQTIGGIETQSVQAVLQDEYYLYVAAQDSIVKFYLPTRTRVAATEFNGISTVSMAVAGDFLLVGNWYGQSSNNISVYNKSDLSFVKSVSAVARGASTILPTLNGVIVVQNMTTSSYQDSAGYFVKLNPITFDFEEAISFNSSAEISYATLVNNYIYAFSGSSDSVLIYNTVDGSSVRFEANVDIAGGYSGSQLAQSNSHIFVKSANGIAAFDLATNTFTEVVSTPTVTAFNFDTINGRFLVTATDYVAFKYGLVFDAAGAFIDSFEVGYSPECLHIAYNQLPEAENDNVILIPGFDRDTFNVVTNDFDPEGSTLEIEIVQQSANSFAYVEDNKIIYEPIESFKGLDSVQYSACDAYGACANAWLYVDVITPLSTTSPGSTTNFDVYPTLSMGDVVIESDAPVETFYVVDQNGVVVYSGQFACCTTFDLELIKGYYNIVSAVSGEVKAVVVVE